MPSFSGKFQYLDADASAVAGGPCQVTFEAEVLTLTPASGPPLAFDLGDIDVFRPGDYELTLTLYTGKKLLLAQFGKAFQNFSHDLLEAYRNRLLQCLLLEDFEEVARFEGFTHFESQEMPGRSFSGPAEFRLYNSNLAVLPLAATGFQWRLADIEQIRFDEASYAVALDRAGERLTVTKLARRTGEFADRLKETAVRLSEKSAQTLQHIFPFLNPDQFRSVAGLMKEGHGVPLARLEAVHPKIAQALVSNVVDSRLKPYFETLLSHTPAGWLYAGFKILRKDEEEELSGQEPAQPENQAGGEETSETSQAPATAPLDGAAPQLEPEEEEPVLHWFFFPLARQSGTNFPDNLLAWEATSKSGRATYFFRLLSEAEPARLHDPSKCPELVEESVRQLNRAIVLLNFRREPIYLSDDALEIEPRFRRYAIACRKIPELRRLRGSFLGRAIHTSPAAWQKQLEGFLAKA